MYWLDGMKLGCIGWMGWSWDVLVGWDEVGMYWLDGMKLGCIGWMG